MGKVERRTITKLKKILKLCWLELIAAFLWGLSGVLYTILAFGISSLYAPLYAIGAILKFITCGLWIALVVEKVKWDG